MDPDPVFKNSWIRIRFVLRGWIRIWNLYVLRGWNRIRSISDRIRNPCTHTQRTNTKVRTQTHNNTHTRAIRTRKNESQFVAGRSRFLVGQSRFGRAVSISGRAVSISDRAVTISGRAVSIYRWVVLISGRLVPISGRSVSIYKRAVSICGKIIKRALSAALKATAAHNLEPRSMSKEDISEKN